MSILSLMIVGNKNEPLWSLDPGDPADPPKDCFGFSDDAWRDSARSTNLSFEKEFKMHASLDRLEDRLGSKANTLPRWQRSSNWVGSLGCIEDGEVYCYVSASNVKMLAMIERPEIIQLKKNRETEIKILLAKIYNCYIEHTMNPFSTIRGPIQPPCTRFNEGVKRAIDGYNESIKDRQAQA